MIAKGSFAVPDLEPDRLHLYRVAGVSGSRSGETRDGAAYTEFDVDLFGDEDETYVCDVCKKKTDSGWLHGTAAVGCKKCVVLHTTAYQPCVLFHKFSRRCWSDTLADHKPSLAWTEVREKATVYPDLATAEAARNEFLQPVQKAIAVVPLEKFDEVYAQYKESF